MNKWINCTLYVTHFWVDQGMESINGRHWLSVMLTSYRLTGGWSRWSATNFKIIGSAFWHFIRDRHVKKRDNINLDTWSLFDETYWGSYKSALQLYCNMTHLICPMNTVRVPCKSNIKKDTFSWNISLSSQW